jgi:hypothetical protein
MIKTIFYLAFLIVQQCAYSQLKYTTTNTALVKLLPVKKYTGKQYRLSIDIKNEPSDDISGGTVMVLQTKKQDWEFLENTRKTFLPLRIPKHGKPIPLQELLIRKRISCGLLWQPMVMAISIMTI